MKQRLLAVGILILMASSMAGLTAYAFSNPPVHTVAIASMAPATSTADPTLSPTPHHPITGTYLLSFHACNPETTDCADPRHHQTYLAQSNDGAHWTLVPGWTPYGGETVGSVPDVIRRGDTIYVYTPNYVRRYRVASGVWEDPVPVYLSDPDSEGYVDPSLFVDAQGRLVLFYLVNEPGKKKPEETDQETWRVHSAVEVPGSDGTQFVAEAGDRVQIVGEEMTTDPDIFYDGTRYVLYLSRGLNILAFSSDTLHGTYTPISQLPENGHLTAAGGVGSGYYHQATSQYWTYVHDSQGNILRATHTTLDHFLGTGEFTRVIDGASIGLGSSYHVESPGFAVNLPYPTPAADLHVFLPWILR